VDDDNQPVNEHVQRLAGLSRREMIAAISAVGAAAAIGVPELASASPRRARDAAELAARAAAIPPAGGDLGAIDHIVFLMLENRSYDHYFGAYPRGRGFDDHPADSLRRFAQPYPGSNGAKLSPPNKLLPFRLKTPLTQNCTNDLTHSWHPMHLCWNDGKMNDWVRVHTSEAMGGEGDPAGAMTMGYLTRKELPFYWSLADHFTICDAYHASVLGPTHPNRLMANSGTIDPAGKNGGPITATTVHEQWTLTWSTIQEHLQDKNVPWKVYHPDNTHVSGKYAKLKNYETCSPSLYNPDTGTPLLFSDHILPYFKAFKSPSSELHKRAFLPTWPNNFDADVKSGNLPAVSWIIPPLGFDEHPSSAPDRGMWFSQQIVNTLMSNKKVWARTALFIMYDENDGFFDHVIPPVAPPGTPGEYITAKTINPTENPDGILGPVGLGIRVPMMVVSPFSRGGHISSEVFDHTSQLKLVAERFGVEVPNVSEWRKKTVGDLTGALFRGKRDMSMPAMPTMALATMDNSSGACASQDTEMGGSAPSIGGAAPAIPTQQRMPTQHGTTVPATKWYPRSATATEHLVIPHDHGHATTKSAANHLVHGGTREEPAKGR
jgi:phospholipase C